MPQPYEPCSYQWTAFAQIGRRVGNPRSYTYTDEDRKQLPGLIERGDELQLRLHNGQLVTVKRK